MALWSALLLSWVAGFAASQEPGAELIAGLDGPLPEDRLAAAEQIAEIGPDVEDWLEKNLGKGSAMRQRGVLLAASLLDTPGGHALVADAARAGRRPDAQRAWALLLYGMSHPEAGRDPKRDWKRAASDFERACLLAGYLAHPRMPEWDDLLQAVGRKPTTRHQALLGLLAARAGERADLEGEEALLRAARLLSSTIPGQPAIPADELAELGAGVPMAWRAAARREPGRSFDELRGTPLRGEEASAVLGLREIPADERAAVFAFLIGRVESDPAASWLWGLAGELGLALPAADPEQIPRWEAAGMVQAALFDFEAVRAAARARADVARAICEAREDWSLDEAAPVLVLALAGRQEDHVWFQAQLAEGGAAARAWLQPLWLLAASQYGDVRAREALLAGWALRLGAGTTGFLDQAGKTFAGLSLIAGTEAGDETTGIRSYSSAFAQEHDHPITDEFYLDLAVLLDSAHYRWRFDV